jgi:signal transduction histidine kinase
MFHFRQEIDTLMTSFKKSDKVEININIQEMPGFRTDAFRLRTILRNLISNSLTYHDPGMSDPVIDLLVSITSTHCHIQLKDNGTGINPGLQSRVFEMFFRGSEQSKGTGLGLYIVKSMVEKLKGQISFESHVGQGTHFSISLPSLA